VKIVPKPIIIIIKTIKTREIINTKIYLKKHTAIINAIQHNLPIKLLSAVYLSL